MSDNASITTELTRAAAELSDPGYTILKSILDDELVRDLERSLIHVHAMQYCKIGDLSRNSSLAKKPFTNWTVDDFDAAITQMDGFDREALYHATQMFSSTPAASGVRSHPLLLRLAGQCLKCPGELIQIHGPSFFPNLPTTTRLLYRWHTEAHYYPKRNAFLNFWMPMFRGKRDNNGTMCVALRSHKRVYSDCNQYQGYDSDNYGQRNTFVQLEIPDTEISDCEIHRIEAMPGDVVIFDRNLVHCSTPNQSAQPSYMIAMRAFDFRGDLTLSCAPAAGGYKAADYSRPGVTRYTSGE